MAVVTYRLRSLCRLCIRLRRLPRRRWQCPEGRRKTDSGPEKGQILSSKSGGSSAQDLIK